MFGHPKQHGHMMSGVEAALKSKNTPKHLRPHLEKRMKTGNPKAGYNPQTAAKPQNTLKTAPPGPGGAKAQGQISGPPAPFGNKLGVLKPVGSVQTRGTGNTAGKKKKSAFYGGQ